MITYTLILNGPMGKVLHIEFSSLKALDDLVLLSRLFQSVEPLVSVERDKVEADKIRFTIRSSSLNYSSFVPTSALKVSHHQMNIDIQDKLLLNNLLRVIYLNPVYRQDSSLLHKDFYFLADKDGKDLLSSVSYAIFPEQLPHVMEVCKRKNTRWSICCGRDTTELPLVQSAARRQYSTL